MMSMENTQTPTQTVWWIVNNDGGTYTRLVQFGSFASLEACEKKRAELKSFARWAEYDLVCQQDPPERPEDFA